MINKNYNPKLILLLITFLLFSNYSQSQISVGSIEKKTQTKKIIEPPKYEAKSDFESYYDFYKNNPDIKEKCNENEFYQRYLGTEIYYPMFPEHYRTDEIIIFKEKDSLTLLNWSDIGEKYFTIKNISRTFGKSDYFKKVKDIRSKISYSLEDGLLFELTEKDTNEKYYVVEPDFTTKFIVSDYYERIEKFVNKTDFVNIREFNARKIPLGEDLLYVDKGTVWKGKLTLLRNEDLRTKPTGSVDDFDIKFMVVLSKGDDKILVYLFGKDYYEPLFKLFDTVESNNKKKELSENEKRVALTELKNKYGNTFGQDVFNRKISVGMNKEMCSEAWGITLNKRFYLDQGNEFEIWEYVGFGKIIFKDGKVSNIIKY
ncbi:hypothetical protein [Winogradskyella immobilis]|uniref:Uncharacterized protein n=1 Tax=Winogradskyella immobilis TaxID=2816852 RepID=A0ABS8ER19_9FLAO|nr:hypothetical protein [Winogradskyella immobilis]MCC1485623.1 hypothetical protein [Winogradskyella immobilis]MCG0017715.1 hypothetical protein [Winogradskyella immobilis]